MKKKLRLEGQAKEFIDDLLKKGDKETFEEVTSVMKKALENQEASNPIYMEYDEKVIEKLNSYKRIEVEEVGVFYESAFGEGMDITLFMPKSEISLFSVHTSKSRDEFLDELEHHKKEKRLYFKDAHYKDCAYKIKLDDFLLSVSGISFDSRE